MTVKARMRETTDAAKLIADSNVCEAALKQQFPEVSWIFFEPDDLA